MKHLYHESHQSHEFFSVDETVSRPPGSAEPQLGSSRPQSCPHGLRLTKTPALVAQRACEAQPSVVTQSLRWDSIKTIGNSEGVVEQYHREFDYSSSNVLTIPIYLEFII